MVANNFPLSLNQIKKGPRITRIRAGNRQSFMRIWGKVGEYSHLPFLFKNSACSEYPERNSSQKSLAPIQDASAQFYSTDKEDREGLFLAKRLLEIIEGFLLALSRWGIPAQHNYCL